MKKNSIYFGLLVRSRLEFFFVFFFISSFSFFSGTLPPKYNYNLYWYIVLLKIDYQPKINRLFKISFFFNFCGTLPNNFIKLFWICSTKCPHQHQHPFLLNEEMIFKKLKWFLGREITHWWHSFWGSITLKGYSLVKMFAQNKYEFKYIVFQK
jgi:hypothetical protein